MSKLLDTRDAKVKYIRRTLIAELAGSMELRAKVVIVGAGIGGLTSAALLAARGCEVTVIEKEDAVGGKARSVMVDGQPIAAGPTVFTMRDVFDDIFRACGAELSDYIEMQRAQVLARHAWSTDERLDLFDDPARSEAAIGDFAGAKAASGYREFRAQAKRVYEVLDKTMMRAPKPATPLSLVSRIGITKWSDLRAGRPYESLWNVLGEHFPDPRLRQLFGRYATYCGSSPFAASATLMLIAHVEAMGVWLIKGGISALADALQKLAERHGAQFRLGEPVARIERNWRKVTGVTLASGELIAADAVIVNADPTALADGLLGQGVRKTVRPVRHKERSLSAYVWMAHAQTSGFDLSHHNVFFSGDYPAEFADIASGKPPTSPSVYICAQDRAASIDARASARERLQIIVNAPANGDASGDTHAGTPEEIDQCTKAMEATLAHCGLMLEQERPQVLTTPSDFARLFPSTGGALYGRDSHGWAAPFRRQGPRAKIRGLYCTGGATHPGAGVPMAALSGQLAARMVIVDHVLTRRFHPAAMPGGMSMRSAPTASTA